MEVHPLAWTPEQVARFWDYWAQRPDGHTTYFASQVGRGVCRFLQHVRPLAGLRVLDYGAGPGHLVEQLLQRGARVWAVEYSPQCVQDLNQRFRRERLWGEARPFDGNRLPWGDDRFDVVCCLETIEHLLPEHVNVVLAELRRVVRPGGVVLLTTPNAEDLQAQTVFCPNCCSEFHRWQHMRRWTADSLRRRLEGLGYEVRFCRGLSFHNFQPARPRWRDLVTWRLWRTLLKDAAVAALDRARPRPFPESRALRRRLRGASQHHLVAVAEKPVTTSASASHVRLTPPVKYAVRDNSGRAACVASRA
jgi:SAM-dependent methyltransferase